MVNRTKTVALEVVLNFLKGQWYYKKSSFNKVEGGTKRAIVNGDTIQIPLKQNEIDEYNKQNFY